jgi:hypothetical protein
MKEKMAHRVGAVIVVALTTLGTFGRTNRRKMVINLDRLAPYQGDAQDEQPLGGSRGSDWSKHCIKTKLWGGR